MSNGPRKPGLRGLLVLVALSMMVLLVAGCGDSDDDSSGSEGTADVAAREAQTGSAAKEAAKLGEEASEREGEPVKLPTKTIGVLNVAGGSEATLRTPRPSAGRRS